MRGKGQFKKEDIKNIKMGESWVYWIEQRTKIKQTNPELIVLQSIAGLGGRAVILSMSGGKVKKKKRTDELEKGDIGLKGELT